jgi:hypothetical protein
MALKNTVKGIQDLLHQITTDLQKAEHGNKAASQRVRTGTIKLEKLAKVYRKESISEEKKTKGTKKPSKAKAAKAAKPAKAKAKAAKPAAKPAAKKKAHKATVKASHLSVRKPTAKLPKKHKK